jgi:hypothetical protein
VNSSPGLFGLLFLDYIDLSNIPPGLEPLLEASLGANLIALIARYVVMVIEIAGRKFVIMPLRSRMKK